MTAQPSSYEHPFVRTLADAHVHALDCLDSDRPLDAVVWLSAHVAAAQRTIHPTGRHSPGGALALRTLRTADGALEHVLRRAEQHFSGDGLAAQLDEQRLDHALRQALAAHDRAERALVRLLADDADAGQLAAVAAAYADALEHAPTRPHPHAPHRGLLGAAAFRVDAWRDRVMDTMDGRHVPAPRASRPTLAPGKWGRYLLGDMED
jgi:hypothetical protein